MNQRICPRRDNSGYGIVARARARRLSTGRSRLESEIFSEPRRMDRRASHRSMYIIRTAIPSEAMRIEDLTR